MNTHVLTNSDEVLITFSSMVRASHVCHLFTFLMPQVPKVHLPPDGTPIHSPQSLWAAFLCTHHSLIQNPNNSLAESQRWPSARDNSNVPFFLEWGTGLPDRHCHHWEQQKYNPKEREKEEQTLIGGSGGIRVKILHWTDEPVVTWFPNCPQETLSRWGLGVPPLHEGYFHLLCIQDVSFRFHSRKHSSALKPRKVTAFITVKK